MFAQFWQVALLPRARDFEKQRGQTTESDSILMRGCMISKKVVKPVGLLLNLSLHLPVLLQSDDEDHLIRFKK